jgi:branched-subunit amino acid ABC-type transport system permease component
MGELIIGQLIAALTRAMLLFIISSGLTFILGVLGVVNMAHGSFYMLGAYLASTIIGCFAMRMSGNAFWLAMIFAPIIVGLAGGLVEYFGLRRVYHRGEVLIQLILTYAVVLIIADAVQLIWGPEFRYVTRPDFLAGMVSFAGIVIPNYNLFLIGMGLLIAAILWLLFYHTKFGKTVRAVSTEREIASTLGINVPYLFTLVVVLGCGLAGLGGVLAASFSAISPTMDAYMVIQSFVVVIIGGLGSFGGAIIGALIVGLVDAFGILIFPRIALVSIFIVMATILVLRPWGLLGSPLGPLTK